MRHAAAIEPPIQAIRIDSGDLGDLARQARAILDQHGRPSVKIMVSGDLDEYRIARLVELGRADRRLRRRDRADHVARRAGAGDGLQARRAGRRGEVQAQPGQEDLSDGQAGLPPPRPRRAGSAATTSPGPTSRPRVSRCSSRSFAQAGWSDALPSLESIRGRCREQLAALPERLLALDAQPDYPITYSEALEADARRLMARS